MKKIKRLSQTATLIAFFFSYALVGCATDAPMHAGTTSAGEVEGVSQPVSTREVNTGVPSPPVDADAAIAALTAGNDRFVSNHLIAKDFAAQIQSTKGGQHPFAFVLSCIDSRVPPEIIFDQNLGDLFVARVAGNVENSDILGSMEFGTQLVHAKVIVVMGHTSCGAVKGACEDVKLEHLTPLLAKIKPAVKLVKSLKLDFDKSNPQDLDLVAQKNVQLTVKRILAQSKTARHLVNEGKLKIVGALYDVSSGKVNFIP